MSDENGSRGLEELFKQGARRLSLRAGQQAIEPESRHTDVIYIHSGEVRVFQIGPDDSMRLASIFGAGDWIGASALAGVQYNGSLVATIATEVSILPVNRFLHALQQRPEMAIAVLKQAAGRLMSAYEDAARLVFDDCNERLVKALISLSDSPAAIHDGPNVTVRITHQQLAQAVGAARETISLALTDLRNENLLETGRNRLIFNPQALRECRSRRKVKRPEPVEAVSAVA